jgi:DNA-binding CsgD family transcriptional regulator/tetratricopeptide (TPR) repeat protein
VLSRRSNQPGASDRERESLRARFRAATELAIGNFVDRASAALEELERVVDAGDDEMMARYCLGVGLLRFKRRSIDGAFEMLQNAIGSARRYGDAALLGGMLTNYATASAQDGSVTDAIACLEEFERLQSPAPRSFAGPLSMVEALLVAGSLRRAAQVLHELYDRYVDTPALIGAATVGIPLGVLLEDDVLLAKSRDVALLDLAFIRGEQWLTGPLVESFCFLYEHEDARAAHDNLLATALDRMSTVDNSLPLAVRAARLGDARRLPQLAKMVEADCPSATGLHAARKSWFEATVAVRHANNASAMRLGIQAAEGFANAQRPLLRAAALATAGMPDDARAVLRFCGATKFPEIRWAAAATRHGSTKLTARELEVARLAANGLPNRAIAEALDVSERTVHRHFESIFGKLGIHSRWQLSETSLGESNRG